MSREEELLESIRKINLGREPVMARMVEGFVKIIENKIKIKGWDETMAWCRQNDQALTNNNALSTKLKHLYSQTYAKMWKITQERKEEG